MKNRKLFVSAEDYRVMAGPSWPTYDDYVNGAMSDDPEVFKEMTEFTEQKRKQGVIFPINTATACQSKWTWSTIFLNRLATSSCHRVRNVKFSLDEFDNLHNLPKKLDDRRLMLEGKWPQGGCEYCQKIEEAGGFSDRMHNLEIRNMTPPELEDDPTALVVTPRLIEIFAQNTCNLACVYCNGGLSSRIEQESHKFGKFEKNGVIIPEVHVPVSTNEYFAKFLEYLEKNISTLRRIHLLGGETFLQHELMDGVLSVLERNPNPRLELNIFSNFNVPDSIWNKYTSRIKDLQQRGNIEIFDLTASIDCWGPQSEYVRNGLNLDKFEQKLEWAARQDESWLRLYVNQTVTSMTIKTMPELIDIINKYNKYRYIGQYASFVSGGPLEMCQHPENFAWSTWEEDFNKILNKMPTEHNGQRLAIIRMKGLVAQLKTKSNHDLEKISQLHTYLDELDRRRGTDWRSLFPHLIV